MLTETQLRAFLPAIPTPALWLAALNAACARFGITAPVRLAACLAQVAHESSGFTRLVENLNYRAEGLMKTWPSRFPTLAKAKEYARQPEKIANYVYASRYGNGDTASGDGWRYRGRGLIQLTFLDNYFAAERALGIPLVADPDRVAKPEVASLTAAHYWHARGLNLIADQNTPESFDRISRRINGGEIGIEERRLLWARAKEALAA